MFDPKHRLGRRVHDALPANVTIRPATPGDCAALGPRLRKEDAREASAASGLPAEYAMKFGLLTGGALVACIDGSPEMIYGCGGDELVGVPWMLGSPLPFTPKWSRVFLRNSKGIIADWQSRHAILTNFADERNESHLRWLRWLGFRFIARDPTYGVAGLPFLQFARIKPNV